jgi:hypothetical protein
LNFCTCLIQVIQGNHLSKFKVTRFYCILITNNIGGVMVSIFNSSAIDHGFGPRSGQTKDYKIDKWFPWITWIKHDLFVTAFSLNLIRKLQCCIQKFNYYKCSFHNVCCLTAFDTLPKDTFIFVYFNKLVKHHMQY